MECDNCSICLLPLKPAEVCTLNCGHVFHTACFKQLYLRQKIMDAKALNFEGKRCPLCRFLVASSSCPEVNEEAETVQRLFAEMKADALSNLAHQKMIGPDADKLKTEGKLVLYEELVLSKADYFMCGKCKHPYFGGVKECRSAEDHERFEATLKTESLVCAKCIHSGRTACSLHGEEHTVFKCKFCCRVAIWVCSGTHWCEPCHSQSGTIYSLPREQLPKCDCKCCPLGIPHPTNGEEFALGCALCRVNGS